MRFSMNSTLLCWTICSKLWAIDNCKTDYMVEIIKEVCDSLRKGKKHMCIANTSEEGWKTVSIRAEPHHQLLRGRIRHQSSQIPSS